MRFCLARLLSNIRFQIEGGAGLTHIDDFEGNTIAAELFRCPIYVQVNGMLVEVWGADTRFKGNGDVEEIHLKLKGDKS